METPFLFLRVRGNAKHTKRQRKDIGQWASHVKDKVELGYGYGRKPEANFDSIDLGNSLSQVMPGNRNGSSQDETHCQEDSLDES